MKSMSSVVRVLGWMLLVTLGFSCAATPSKVREDPSVEARSFDGVDLVRPAFSLEVRNKLELNLAEAIRAHEQNPTDEMAAIWHGRRLGYLARYREAVQVFGKALASHPQSFKLLRHRGHRYITLRRLDDAIGDLSLASNLTREVPDALEPDGAPNPSGVPRSTTRSNIEYHLGLALYLAGRFEEALAAWERCLELSRVNDDMLVAATYWNVLTLWRLGRVQRADELLATIRPQMDILENHDYHELLLLFQGVVPENQVMDKLAAEGLGSATLAYGMGAWNLARGNERPAREIFASILSNKTWAAFGYIAAEAELWR